MYSSPGFRKSADVDPSTSWHYCGTCNKAFPLRYQLLNHAKAEHGGKVDLSSQSQDHDPTQSRGRSEQSSSEEEEEEEEEEDKSPRKPQNDDDDIVFVSESPPKSTLPPPQQSRFNSLLNNPTYFETDEIEILDKPIPLPPSALNFPAPPEWIYCQCCNQNYINFVAFSEHLPIIIPSDPPPPPQQQQPQYPSPPMSPEPEYNIRIVRLEDLQEKKPPPLTRNPHLPAEPWEENRRAAINPPSLYPGRPEPNRFIAKVSPLRHTVNSVPPQGVPLPIIRQASPVRPWIRPISQQMNSIRQVNPIPKKITAPPTIVNPLPKIFPVQQQSHKIPQQQKVPSIEKIIPKVHNVLPAAYKPSPPESLSLPSGTVRKRPGPASYKNSSSKSKKRKEVEKESRPPSPILVTKKRSHSPQKKSKDSLIIERVTYDKPKSSSSRTRDERRTHSSPKMSDRGHSSSSSSRDIEVVKKESATKEKSSKHHHPSSLTISPSTSKVDKSSKQHRYEDGVFFYLEGNYKETRKLMVYSLLTHKKKQVAFFGSISEQVNCTLKYMNDSIYILGGQGGGLMGSASAKLHIFDLALGQWRPEPIPSMFNERCEFDAVITNDYLYSIGGDQRMKNGGYWQNMKSVERIALNPGSGNVVEKWSWKTMDSMSMRRQNCGVTVSKGKIYVLGGYAGDKNRGHARATESVESLELSISNPKWQTEASMLTKRIGACAVATNDGLLYALGGGTEFDETLSKKFKSIEIFNPARNNFGWVYGPPMKKARQFFSAFAHDDSIFVVGGDGEDPTMEKLDLKTLTWKIVKEAKLDNDGHYWSIAFKAP